MAEFFLLRGTAEEAAISATRRVAVTSRRVMLE